MVCMACMFGIVCMVGVAIVFHMHGNLVCVVCMLGMTGMVCMVTMMGMECFLCKVGMVCMACMFGIVCMVGVVIVFHMYGMCGMYDQRKFRGRNFRVTDFWNVRERVSQRKS